MFAVRHSCLIVVLLYACGPALGDPAEDREAWRAQVNKAKARALEARRNSLAEFERLKAEPRTPPPSLGDQLSQRNSEAILNDSSLKRGDIVSTVEGLFIFLGRGDRDPTPGDFAPYGPHPAVRAAPQR